MRIDLHCHSMHSKRPSLWVMQKIGCPESFTQPAELYRIMREKGMTGVTITDHNVIDGCLDIAHLPGTFVSEEVTTYFPEDRCKIHVLVYDITEPQHEDIMGLRDNIFDLVKYLDARQIFHVLAHPIFGVNDRLTLEHVEQCMLLFKNFELNGDQNADANRVLKRVSDSLTQESIARLVEKHGIQPHFSEPWKKNWTGGSDDHSSLHLASTYTEVEGAETLTQFWRGIEQGRARIVGGSSTPLMMAHNVYGIAYQFYKSKLGLDRHVNKDVFLKFLDRALQSTPAPEAGIMDRVQSLIGRRRSRTNSAQSPSLLGLCRSEAEKLIASDVRLATIVRNGTTPNDHVEETWFDFANQISNRVLLHFGNRFLDRILRAQLFDMFASLGSAGALYSVSVPYLVAFSLHAKTRRFAYEVLDRFSCEDLRLNGESARIAHFTDTYYDVNGVAQTLRQQIQSAQRTGKEYTILTCAETQPQQEPGVRNFRPIGNYSLPEYPELALNCPPFLELLRYCYEQGFTHIHSATPGPMGLAALAIARILKLPISGTYHTSLPQYALYLTDNDGFVEEFAWKAMIWYYDQMDFVYVPSKSTGDELIEKGINPKKVRVYPRGIDIERFHPAKRNGILNSRYGIGHGAVLLYVGRVSQEKNLHVLSKAFNGLIEKGVDAHLLIVGDGPYCDEMKGSLAGTPTTFTGYLSGEDLASVYASSDIFVFPSTTDTFGNVILEAQASGLPVIVTDCGGPCENLLPDETGMIVRGDDVATLEEAMIALASDPERVRNMGMTARRYAEARGFDAAFEQTWVMFTGETPVRDTQQPTLARSA